MSYLQAVHPRGVLPIPGVLRVCHLTGWVQKKICLSEGSNAPYLRVGFQISKSHIHIQKSGKNPPPPGVHPKKGSKAEAQWSFIYNIAGKSVTAWILQDQCYHSCLVDHLRRGLFFISLSKDLGPFSIPKCPWRGHVSGMWNNSPYPYTALWQKRAPKHKFPSFMHCPYMR